MTLSHRPVKLLAGALALVALFATSASLRAAAPSNDVCSQAAVVPTGGPFPYSTTVDTTQATNDGGDPEFTCNTSFPSPAPAGSVTHSVWFAFTPGVTDNYKIDTLGSTPSGLYDTILGVYTGICGTLTPVTDGCNDNAAGTLQSSVQVRLNAGTTYFILVAGLGSRDPLNNNHIIPSSGGSLKLNVSRVAVNYPFSYVIPSVAHAQGATLFVSDLSVSNPDASDGSFYIQFLNHGNFGETSTPASQPSGSPATIRGGGSVLFSDVLSSGVSGVDIGSNPYGALLIRSTVRLLTGARTYTTASTGGTFGQFALGVDTSSGVLEASQSGRIIGVRENATSRTNVAVFNLSGTACNVQFELRAATGELVVGGGQQIRVVPPNTMVQASGIRSFFSTGEDILNASIKITNLTAGCKIGAIAYVIDGNSTPGSNDPFAVPLQK